MTEETLFYASRADLLSPWRARRVVPCACGGFIAADPTDELGIVGAVTAHLMEPRHEAWRRDREENDGRAS